MARVIGFLHQLKWANPIGSPPDGKEIEMEVFLPVSDESCRIWPMEMEQRYWELRKLNQELIYVHVIKAITKSVKPRDKEILAKIRRGMLEKRMQENFPLFADQFINQEINRNALYYEGETSPERKEARELAEAEHRMMLEKLGIQE